MKASLLKPADLKTWLHRDLSQADKLLLILATFEAPCSVKAIKERATEAGLSIGKTWNPSATLSRTKGLAIKVPDGWEITDSGRQHLRNLGVGGLSPAAVQVAADLRSHLSGIGNEDVRSFVEEAVKCFEAELFRSAVVMSWLGAIGVLQDYVVNSRLDDLNKEARRVNPIWKDAVTADDLGRMKESDFLDRLAAISLLGKNAKERLKVQLDLRNACGHPNSFVVGRNTVTSHIEVLILNVFKRFA
jgi:hypothetical protein